jgi:hypothetical protein
MSARQTPTNFQKSGGRNDVHQPAQQQQITASHQQSPPYPPQPATTIPATSAASTTSPKSRREEAPNHHHLKFISAAEIEVGGASHWFEIILQSFE